MPGMPSGENHSCDSQQCGRKRMPRVASSPYSRSTARSRSRARDGQAEIAESQAKQLLVAQRFPGMLHPRRARTRASPISGRFSVATCPWMLVPSLGKSYLQFARPAFPFAVLEVSIDRCPHQTAYRLFRQVTVETVTTLAGVANAAAGIRAATREHAAAALPFALHEWHLTWCRYFLGCDPHIQDEPLFYILRDSSGACVAILPLIVSRRRLGPLKIVSISLLGADPAITEIRTPHGRERIRAADGTRCA